MDLADQKCTPCEIGQPPLTGDQIRPLRMRLSKDWEVVDNHHLQRTFRFDDFRGALEFANHVGELAEREQHHPDIHLSYGRVTVQTWTHKIGGLHENDFILAAKIDRLAR